MLATAVGFHTIYLRTSLLSQHSALSQARHRKGAAHEPCALALSQRGSLNLFTE